MSLFARARHYDPVTARFTQEDTYRGDVMDVRSLNLYAYCYNDPVNFVDPSGHDAESNINSAFNAWQGGYITYEQYAENVRLNGGVPVSSSWQPPPKEEWHDPVSLMPPSTPEETLGSYKPEDNVVINSNGTPIGINAEGTGNVIDRSDAASSVTNNKNWSSKQWVVGEGYGTSSFDVIVSEVYADEQYGINSLYDLYLLYNSGEIDEEERERLLVKLLNESPKLAAVSEWEQNIHYDIKKGKTIFMQHGLNDSFAVFQDTVVQLKANSRYISLGIISMRTDGNLGKGIHLNDEFVAMMDYFTPKNMAWGERIAKTITSLTNAGNNVLIRTEFSTGTLSFEQQRSELQTMVGSVEYNSGGVKAGPATSDVVFVGHSMGGLASINYGIDYAEAHPDIKVRIITVSTPYHPNNYAQWNWLIGKEMGDGNYDLQGTTSALEKLRNKWNAHKDAGYGTEIYAISIAKAGAEEPDRRDKIGDGVVDIPSQQGRDVNVNGESGYGFNNVYLMPLISSSDSESWGAEIADTGHPYHHVNVTNLEDVAKQINDIIKN